MSTEDTHALRSAPRVFFGAILFAAWGAETIIWVASTVDLAADGEVMAIVTAVVAISLMGLLAGMEGLEVAAIDRSKTLFSSTSQLAGWLAARQLFVALIVTTATLLANRSTLIIPGTGASIDHGILVGLFDLTWTGFTVLWFAQIFPKHLAATNPDRYLVHLRRSLFPVVEFVRKIGVSQPGEWVASAIERRLSWPLTEAQQIEEGVVPREESLAGIWRELIPAAPPRTDAPGSQGVTAGRAGG